MKKTCNIMVRIAVVIVMIGMMSFTGCNQSKGSLNTTNISPTNEVLASDAQNQKILIVTGEYAPYVGEDLENKGFVSELVEAALQNSNIEYEIKFYPWARCSEMVQSGEAWASYPFGHSEFNDETYLFSDAIYHTTHKYYYLKDNKKITDEVLGFDEISDFKDYIFGGANGYWYGDQEEFASLGVTAEWATDTDALLKMLYSKRIDFLIEDELVCNEAIERLFPGEKDKFETLPNEAGYRDYYLIISKDYPHSQELLEQFNSSFHDLNGDDEMLNK